LGKNSEHDGFCLEIIYNYAVTKMQRGNSYIGMTVLDDESNTMKNKAIQWYIQNNKSLSPEPQPPPVSNNKTNSSSIVDPDHNLITFISPSEISISSSSTPDILLPHTNNILYLSLHVTQLSKSLEFYQEKFDAHIIPNITSTSPLLSAMMELGTGTKLQLVELTTPDNNNDKFIFHGQNQGRLAIETPDGDPDLIATRFDNKDDIIYGPHALPPHNERVGVFADLDGHEYAFVEASGYARCIAQGNVPGARTIDWKYRNRFATLQQ
jgi:hypothetical protein